MTPEHHREQAELFGQTNQQELAAQHELLATWLERKLERAKRAQEQ
jgi:hypothetical protein